MLRSTILLFQNDFIPLETHSKITPKSETQLAAKLTTKESHVCFSRILFFEVFSENK